jgi:hypothetical protein
MQTKSLLKKKQIQNRNSSNNVEDTEGGTNQTNLLAKQILSTASLVQQQGGLSNSDLTSVSNSFNQAISNTNIVDKYSVSDLALTSIDIALYKEVLAIAFQPLLNSEIDELNAIYTFTSSKNPQDSAQDIDKLIAMYKDLSERILKVEAPYGAAGIHLKLVNETDKLSTAFINIRHLTDDPVVSTIGFRQYQKYYDELESTLNSLQGYFTKNGII